MKPLFRSLYFQVIVAIALGILLGAANPRLGVMMQPLGLGFIKLIKMLIAPVIFCTVVMGIAGVEDVNDLDESFEVVSEATDVVAVRSALQSSAIDYDSAEVQFVASMDIPVGVDAAGKVFRLVDALEDLDDVQNVFTNVDVPDDVLAALDA